MVTGHRVSRSRCLHASRLVNGHGIRWCPLAEQSHFEARPCGSFALHAAAGGIYHPLGYGFVWFMLTPEPRSFGPAMRDTIERRPRPLAYGLLPDDNGPRHAKTNAGGRLRQMILRCTELKYACRRCARWNFLTCPFFICRRWKY